MDNGQVKLGDMDKLRQWEGRFAPTDGFSRSGKHLAPAAGETSPTGRRRAIDGTIVRRA